MTNNTRSYIKDITLIALFVAVVCILAQISIPISLIPITFQAFAIALCGYVLGTKKSLIATIVYLLLGAVGVPVFASFNGGFHILLSYTGGFLWGFIPYALLCGISKNKNLAIPFGVLGVLVCHIIGTIQYSLVSNSNIYQAFIIASLPFIFKDIILVIIAHLIAKRINKIIKTS